MSLFSRLFKKKSEVESPALSQGVQEFLDGKKNTLSFADIDPKGATLFDGFQKAMELKKKGKHSEAEELLIRSCEPPTIYKGHYREIFKIWRQYNREDIKAQKYQIVTNRVLKMRRLDDEMISKMLQYWSIQQQRELPLNYFDRDRNLLVSDAKALMKSAEALENSENIAIAEKLIERFAQK